MWPPIRTRNTSRWRSSARLCRRSRPCSPTAWYRCRAACRRSGVGTGPRRRLDYRTRRRGSRSGFAEGRAYGVHVARSHGGRQMRQSGADSDGVIVRHAPDRVEALLHHRLCSSSASKISPVRDVPCGSRAGSGGPGCRGCGLCPQRPCASGNVLLLSRSSTGTAFAMLVASRVAFRRPAREADHVRDCCRGDHSPRLVPACGVHLASAAHGSATVMTRSTTGSLTSA